MTTGRINQVTFLSDQDLSSRREPARKDTRSHERGRSPLAWFITDKRQISALVVLAGRALWFFCEPPLRGPSYKAALRIAKTKRAAFRRETFVVDYPGTHALNRYIRSLCTGRIYKCVDYMSTHRVIIQTLLSSLIARIEPNRS